MRNQLIIGGFLMLLLSGCNRCRYGCINGVCIQKECSCEEWYEGDDCGRSVLTIYEGSYEGELVALDTILDTISSALIVIPGKPDQMKLETMDLTVRFTTKTRFTVPEQSWSGWKITGEGEMLVDIISINFLLVDSASSHDALLEARKLD